MVHLPNEIIDRIVVFTNDHSLAISLKRYHAFYEICKNTGLDAMDYREDRRKKDPIAFLAHNAEVHRQWYHFENNAWKVSEWKKKTFRRRFLETKRARL